MTAQFKTLAQRTMAEPTDIDTELAAWMQPDAMYTHTTFANTRIHQGLNQWVRFMQALRLLEEKMAR